MKWHVVLELGILAFNFFLRALSLGRYHMRVIAVTRDLYIRQKNFYSPFLRLPFDVLSLRVST